MKSIRTLFYAAAAALLVVVMFLPALLSLCLEEVAHKKGDEQ